jgi:hypothetical protein
MKDHRMRKTREITKRTPKIKTKTNRKTRKKMTMRRKTELNED